MRPWLGSAVAGRKGFRGGQTTCCAQHWGLGKLSLGRAASASTGGGAPGSPRQAVRERDGVPGLSQLHTGGDPHLCAASANCARWKSAASRRISSQASAITASLTATPGSRRHDSPQPVAGAGGRAAPRAKRPAPTQIANRPGKAATVAAPLLGVVFRGGRFIICFKALLKS